jgi:aerobic-type carbon monoxide dehydrogenase small subunit (CoxS/CutS family)
VEIEFRLSVNSEQRKVRTDPERSLLDVLREDLHLTGSKYGCGEGQCRACTVLLDGRPVTSCLTPISRAAGKKITTIEGLSGGKNSHPVQQAFLEMQAVQCGYCVPGMILTAVALLETNPKPTDSEIVQWMNGNLCRCCGYPNILAAVRRAAEIATARKTKEVTSNAE